MHNVPPARPLIGPLVLGDEPQLAPLQNLGLLLDRTRYRVSTSCIYVHAVLTGRRIRFVYIIAEAVHLPSSPESPISSPSQHWCFCGYIADTAEQPRNGYKIGTDAIDDRMQEYPKRTDSVCRRH